MGRHVQGPFAALAAVGVVMALLAALMFALAFGRRSRRPANVVSNRHPAGSSPTPPPPPQQSAPLGLSQLMPSLRPNAPIFDVLKHRVSTRVAGAGDEAVDAAVHRIRTWSRPVLFGTLAVAALIGVLLGRRR